MARVSSSHEISIEELFATSDDPFVRHQVVRAPSGLGDEVLRW
jgi:hypothetical protein